MELCLVHDENDVLYFAVPVGEETEGAIEMSGTLRILLLVAAVITAVWILRKIRKLKVKMEDAIFWVVFAVILAILGIFPEISFWLTGKLRVQSPANLIFLLMIALLVEKVFTLSIIVSQLEDKVAVLSAERALRPHSADRRLDMVEEGKTDNKTASKADIKTDSKTDSKKVNRKGQ